MFKKIFKAALITIVALSILGSLWHIPLIGIAIKVVVSAALIAWVGFTIDNFKDND